MIAIKDYWSLVKPKQTFLLVYCGVCAMLAGNLNPPPPTAALVAIAFFLSIAGTTAVANYVDRSVDAVMERTKGRPLPSRRIAPWKALCFGVLLVAVSLIMAFNVNILFSAFLVWGVANNVVVYNIFAKRRTPYSILLASPAGAMPVLGGWAAFRGLTLEPALMAGLVILWIPIHIWSIALRWRSDYTKAKIPMLPLDIKNGGRLIVAVSILLAAYSTIAIQLVLQWKLAAVAVLLNAALIVLSLKFAAKPTERNAWVLLKFTGFYIFIVFLAWPVSGLL
jgi:protoheme IX farnesyltransferase